MVKLTILGAAGGIGQPLSLLCRTNPNINELALFDIVNAPGVATDLSHYPTLQTIKGYSPSTKEDQSQLKAALEGSDIVVIPAGVPRKPGMTRNDLFKINAGIVKGLVHAAGVTCPQAFICVISNPVNSTVPIAVEELKRLGIYDPAKVFGVTTLDSLRLEEFLSEVLAKHGHYVDPAELQGDVFTVGGHSGQTIVPLLNYWAKGIEEDEYEALIHRVQFGGDEVVKAKNGKGSATLSMAVAAFRFISHLLQAINGETVKEVAFVKFDELPNDVPSGLKLQYFNLPILLGPTGATKVTFPTVISKREVELIAAAAEQLVPEIDRGFDFIHGSKL